MGDLSRVGSAGRSSTFSTPAGVHGVVVTGFLSIAITLDALAELERAVGSASEPQAVVLDVVAIEGFEPGVPAKIIQWLGARAGVVPFGVVATTSPVLAATVRAVSVVLNGSQLVAVASRGEAVRRASHAMRGRTNTGVHRKDLRTPSSRARSA
jgi:hypothetical protein